MRKVEPELIVGTDGFRDVLNALRERKRREGLGPEAAHLLAQMEKAQRVGALEAMKTTTLGWSESKEGSEQRVREALALLAKVPTEEKDVLYREISVERDRTGDYVSAIDTLLAR